MMQNPITRFFWSIFLMMGIFTPRLLAQLILFYPMADTVFISAGCFPSEVRVSVVESPAKIDSVKIQMAGFTSSWINPPNGKTIYFDELFFLVNDSLQNLNYELLAVPQRAWETWIIPFPFDSTVAIEQLWFNLKLRVLRGDVRVDSLSQIMKAYRGTGVEAAAHPLADFSLAPAYPNPFNATTRIRFELQNPAPVNLTIFNNRGQRVATLADAVFLSGKHSLAWNPASAASGIYLIRLQAGDQALYQKCVLVK